MNGDIKALKERIRKLEERLAHANGALDDIVILVTSCVPKDTPEKYKEIFGVVLRRCLTSASQVYNKPGFYIHDYEKELYEEYFSGKLKACASDLPAIEEAKRLLK